ncbi:MAG: DUF6580 family putative transport protein [Bacteroidota bacterium]
MINQQKNLRVGVISAIIVVAALSRLLLVMIPNFSPIGAIALFGAAYFGKRYLAFLIPLAAMWMSDLLINNVIYPRMFPEYYDGAFAWGVSWWVYGAFTLTVIAGFFMLRKVSFKNVALASVITAIAFFLITNFGVWAGGAMYPKTMSGLMLCYGAAIPFFWNTLLSNLIFAAALFGGYEFLKQRYTVLNYKAA